MYKVISWVTFKSQCEQSDDILRKTFQCKQSLSSAGEQFGNDLNNVVTTEEALQQFPEIDVSNAKVPENTEHIEALTECDKTDAYEDEVIRKHFLAECTSFNANVQEFLVTANEEDVEASDQRSVDLSKTNDRVKAQSSPQKQVTCDECGTHFRNPDRLKSHQRSVHEGKKFVCSFLSQNTPVISHLYVSPF